MHKSAGDGQLVRPNRHTAVLDFSPFISPGLYRFRAHVGFRGGGNAECCICRCVVVALCCGSLAVVCHGCEVTKEGLCGTQAAVGTLWSRDWAADGDLAGEGGTLP